MAAIIPIQLKLVRVLIVGGGTLAENKQRLLVEMEAQPIWWKSMPDEATLVQESARQDDPNTRFSLVVIADFGAFGKAIHIWAQRHRLLCNLVDMPEKSDVYIPAIIKRGQVRIGIGTGGINPVLSRMVRSRVEQVLPFGLERIVNFTHKWRERVITALPDLSSRREFWEKILFGRFAEQVATGSETEDKLDSIFTKRLLDIKKHKSIFGDVTLVGAGPGDASLLTLKGIRALQSADVVLYDSLISSDIIKLARRDATLEDVGKRRKSCPIAQQDICTRLVELAKQGKQVCRLKGGDPYLFARGGEESQALADAGIAFEVIPGVTTASAIAATTGIPLTHRGYARTLRFLTGHLALGQNITSWQALVNKQETLVIYMGFTHLKVIAEHLIACGTPADMPLACVQNGTLPDQRIMIAKLSEATSIQRQFVLEDGPILLIIGEVVSLRKSILKPSSSDDTKYSTDNLDINSPLTSH